MLVPKKKMDYSKHCIGKLVMWPLLVGVALYISIWTPNIWKDSSALQHHWRPLSNMERYLTLEQTKELETALIGASMGNKTLIIAVINNAYVEGEQTTMLELFLDSFRLGEDTKHFLNHLLLVSVDQIAFGKCKSLHLHCYTLVTNGVDFSGEKLYMSGDFIKMMWTRTLFLGDVLRHGYDFIFTDVDVVWLRDPFPRLSQDQSLDIQFSCDNFTGNPWSEWNPMNTGFYFVRSNIRTISLFEIWYAMKDNMKYKGMKEQDVLQKLLRRGVFRYLGMKVRFLDTLYFSGFCQESVDFKAVISAHANCCQTIAAKVTDLMAMLQVWKMFKAGLDHSKILAGSSNETMSFRWTKHDACRHSMDDISN